MQLCPIVEFSLKYHYNPSMETSRSFYRETQVGDKEPKQFTLFHLTHDSENKDKLDLVKAELENMLKTDKPEVVIAFMELADAGPEFQLAVNELHAKGLSYKRAFEVALYDKAYPEGSPERGNEEERME